MPRILPIDKEKAGADILAAFEKHVTEHAGSRITNMKATLGHSLLAFEVYMQWYPLYENVIEIVGERMAYLFAYAISEGSNCPLCSTFFRRIIIQNGENPDALNIIEEEQALLDFGATISQNRGTVPPSLYNKVAQHYSDQQMVILIAFAGQMVATNLFNNVLEVEVDEYLFPFKKSILNSESHS